MTILSLRATSLLQKIASVLSIIFKLFQTFLVMQCSTIAYLLLNPSTFTLPRLWLQHPFHVRWSLELREKLLSFVLIKHNPFQFSHCLPLTRPCKHKEPPFFIGICCHLSSFSLCCSRIWWKLKDGWLFAFEILSFRVFQGEDQTGRNFGFCWIDTHSILVYRNPICSDKGQYTGVSTQTFPLSM